jgi:hypothetical protein
MHWPMVCSSRQSAAVLTKVPGAMFAVHLEGADAVQRNCMAELGRNQTSADNLSMSPNVGRQLLPEAEAKCRL